MSKCVFLTEFLRPVSQDHFYLPKELSRFRKFQFENHFIFEKDSIPYSIIWTRCLTDSIFFKKKWFVGQEFQNYPLIVRYANLIIIYNLKLVSQTDNLELSTSCEFFPCIWATRFSVVAYYADHASCCGHKVFKANIFTIYLCSAFKNDVGPCLKRK